MAGPERLRELAEATEPRARLIAPFFVAQGPGVTEVLLVRHAQVPVGSTGEDAALTDLGCEQAEALADYLAALPIDAVYASPTNRARQTAARLAARHGLAVSEVEALRDVENNMPRDLSVLEALTREFGEAEAQRRYELMQSVGWTLDLFGGLLESSASLRARVTQAIDRVIDAHPGGRAVVVTHGPPIAAYVSQIMGCSADFIFYPRLTSISMVLAKEGKRTVHLLNATPHFGVL